MNDNRFTTEIQLFGLYTKAITILFIILDIIQGVLTDEVPSNTLLPFEGHPAVGILQLHSIPLTFSIDFSAALAPLAEEDCDGTIGVAGGKYIMQVSMGCTFFKSTTKNQT